MSTALLDQQLTPPEDMLYERVGGKFVEKPMSAFAIWLGSQLYNLLYAAGKTSGAGQAFSEMVFILDVERDLRRRPDVAFVSKETWPLDRLPPWESDWPIAPDLAVEILSPNNTMGAMVRKVREYFQHGVKEVWLALPEERCVQVYVGPKTVKILDAGDTLSTPLIPGWSHVVGDWLPELPETAPV